jgi:hypothetical protein
VTHPNLEAEVNQALREHLALRLSLYFVLALVLVANTALIVMTWRAMRRGKPLIT